METVTGKEQLCNLSELGRLLDEAVDLADRCGESLLAAHLSQALHLLDARVAQVPRGPVLRDPGLADPGGSVLGG